MTDGTRVLKLIEHSVFASVMSSSLTPCLKAAAWGSGVNLCTSRRCQVTTVSSGLYMCLFLSHQYMERFTATKKKFAWIPATMTTLDLASVCNPPYLPPPSCTSRTFLLVCSEVLPAALHTDTGPADTRRRTMTARQAQYDPLEIQSGFLTRICFQALVFTKRWATCTWCHALSQVLILMQKRRKQKTQQVFLIRVFLCMLRLWPCGRAQEAPDMLDASRLFLSCMRSGGFIVQLLSVASRRTHPLAKTLNRSTPPPPSHALQFYLITTIFSTSHHVTPWSSTQQCVDSKSFLLLGSVCVASYYPADVNM